MVWLVVAVTCAALTAAFTARYGVLNQATYLLDPLRRAMPELFRRDWLVGEAPPYLPSFGWLVRWLYAIDPEGTAALHRAASLQPHRRSCYEHGAGERCREV